MSILFSSLAPVNVSPLFGVGILPDSQPVKVAPWKVADAAIKDGRASRRPEVTGRGLTRAEVARITGAENEARFHAEQEGAENVGTLVHLAARNELAAILADRTRAVTMPVGFHTTSGLYVPSEAEEAFAVEAFATLATGRQDARDEAEFELYLAEQERLNAIVSDAMLAIG